MQQTHLNDKPEKNQQRFADGQACLAAALDYLKRGWSALAVCPPDHDRVGQTHEEKCNSPGKAPWGPWKVFQDQLATEKHLRDKWQRLPTLNVGMALGPISGLVRIDVDGPAGEAKLKRLSDGDLPPTLEFTSGKANGSRGLLYAIPEGVEIKTTFEKPDAPKQELRFQAKGAQTVLPPSRHPEGTQYRWLPGHGPDEIEPAQMPTWLVREMAIEPERPVEPSNGKHTIDDFPVEERIKRARAYVSKMPPAISGQQGHTSCFQAVVAILRDFAVPEPDAWPLIEEYNDCCQPPWTKKELDHKVCEALNKSKHSFGDLLLKQPPPVHHNGSGQAKAEPSRIDSGWKPFPVEEFPEPASGFVSAASHAIGCDLSFVALPLLAGLSAAIGNSRRIVLKRAWSEPAVIWAAVVGESGTLKSPAAEAPLAPIMARQAEAMRRHKEEEKEFEISQLHYEAMVAEWKKTKARGEAPVRPERPTCPRYWCSDITVEALAPRLLDAPRGLLLYRDELSGWLRSFDCYRGGRGGDVGHWLSIHGARSALVDRKGGDQRTVFVPRAFASISGGIQPAILAGALAREHFEDGLAARLLVAMPPRVKKTWSEFDIEPSHAFALAQLYEDLYTLDLRVSDQTGFPEPVLVPLSREAKKVWLDFYAAHAGEMIKMTGDLAAAWSKLEGYAARLALVFHCCRVVACEADPGSVDEKSMTSGVALTQWFKNETRRVYAALAAKTEEGERDELVEIMRRHGGRITVRELGNSSRKYRGNAELAEQDLNKLVRSGLAVCEVLQPGEQGGRPTTVWRLVHGVSGTET